MAAVHSDFSAGHPILGGFDLAKFGGYVAFEAAVGHIQLSAAGTFAQMSGMIGDYILGKAVQTTGDLF
jgi:hypothetical protein